MRKAVKQIHLYAGLLCFSTFVVYGVAGITVMLEPAPAERERPQAVVREMAIDVPPGASDRAVADLVRQAAGLTMVSLGTARRNARQQLEIDYYGMNGMTRATLDEPARTVRLERRRNSLAGFINNAHATTLNESTGEWAVRAWAIYNEISLWALIFMSASGVYLWLASRPGMNSARLSFALGAALFVGLWVATR